MDSYMEPDKRITAREAIDRFVRDGDSLHFVALACSTFSILDPIPKRNYDHTQSSPRTQNFIASDIQ